MPADAALNVPALQFVHVADPAKAYLPAVQAIHAADDVEPVLGFAVPALH